MENQIQKVKQPMYQMISEKASKLELIERFGHLNLKEIVHQEYPTIGSLERMHGKESTEKAMAVIVADLSASFGGDLNKNEIMEVVTEVRAGLNRNITLEGLYLICSELKSSSVYGKLTVNKVLKGVKEHLNEQSNAHQMRNYNKHLELKHNEPREKQNPFDDATYKKLKIDHLKKHMKDE